MLPSVDQFDAIQDLTMITIFNFISDIKILTRSRLVSRRFNSLVSQSFSLSFRVDRVISAVDSTLLSFFKSTAAIPRTFEKVKELTVELPACSPSMKEKAVVALGGGVWPEFEVVCDSRV